MHQADRVMIVNDSMLRTPLTIKEEPFPAGNELVTARLGGECFIKRFALAHGSRLNRPSSTKW